MNLQELKEKIAAAGVIGAGGAGFPTAVKIAPGADTLLINASECEPLLYTDFHLLQHHIDTIVQGAELVLQAAEIPRAILALEEHSALRLNWEHGHRLSAHVTVHVLPDAYPAGDEIILVYQVLRRIIRPGKLPISEGVIVLNAETLYNVCRAVEEGIPVTEKWLTIAGKVKQPTVLRVPVGMPVRDLLEQLGETVPENCVAIDGGPAMGLLIDPNTAVVRKTTKGIVILPRDIPAVTNKLAKERVIRVHATSNCCQCTLCTDLCPRALIGYPLTPHLIVRTPVDAVKQNPERYTEAILCSNCGICELVACCQGISPRRMYTQVKNILAQNGIRYTKAVEPEADPEREYRMVPPSRFKRLLGVANLDKMPVATEQAFRPREIRLPLKQHAGALAIAAVKVGDLVQCGDVVAEADGAISARIHSSVNGQVTRVSPAEIVLLPE